MKKRSLIFTLLLPHLAIAQAPVIQSVTPVATSIEKWDKFEAKIALNAAYTNPYNYEEIRVYAVFTAPDGVQTTVDGFYMEDFALDTGTGNLTALSPGNGFRIRFSPDKTGAWSYIVSCTTASGTGNSVMQSFNCTAVSHALNHGFVQASQSNYLKFSDGNQYIPVGENMAWQDANPYLDYSNWIEKLSANGGNYFRFWLCHWGLGLEWKQGVNGFPGLLKYKQSSAFYMDWLFDLCAQKGVYAMFCINHHGQVSSTTDANWTESPYNAANGGPCAHTWDFFTNADAQKAHKNRLRYILARWGYQRSILCWELFNEVNWTDNFTQHQTEIAAWHETMAAYLKQNDAQQRPVSTSFGTAQSEMPAIWNLPDIDFTQRHYYLDNPNLETVLASGARANLGAYDKPVIVAEFGLTTGGNALIGLDPNGIHIHNNLWGGLYGGGMGSAMTWWWDSYIDPANLYPYFNGVSAVAAQAALQAHGFSPATAQITGAPHDLRLDASLGWSELGDTLIQISNSGVITPVNYKLGSFLYGAVWNTQYRRPPKFLLDMPAAGAFSVLVGGQVATNPKIAIWLDGQLVLNVTASPNTIYAINVPMGQHQVKVDNNGTDWMQIASYTVQGLGNAIESYVLKSADNDEVTGWLLNTDYNHAYVNVNGAPGAISGAHMEVTGLQNGKYELQWFNCLSGNVVESGTLNVQNGAINAPIPDLSWDLAFTLKRTSLGIEERMAQSLPFDLYPNPVAMGNRINLAIDLPSDQAATVELLSAAGQQIQHLFSGNLPAGATTLTLEPRAGLPEGIYWIKASSGNRVGLKLLAIAKP